MKYALVTGASTGIGRTTALEMSKNGYFVLLVARNEHKLQETKQLIEQHNGQAQIIPTDLANLKSVNNLIQQIKEFTTELHSIVNIAGIWHDQDEVFAGKQFEQFNQQIILDTYWVGFVSPTLIIHGLLPLMPRGGNIINLSGTFENGGKGWVPYYASKRALEDLTIGLAQELEDKGIKVNCVSPSDTATEQYGKYFPQFMDDAIAPEKIALKIMELCSLENQQNGQVIVMKKDVAPFSSFHY